MPERLRAAQFHAPTLAIVGTVVSLHERLSWFRPAAET
jgi:siroheme synthase